MYVIYEEKKSVLTKFCSSFHCFIAFNVMVKFDPYILVFIFGTIDKFVVVMIHLVVQSKSLKFSGSFFRR